MILTTIKVTINAAPNALASYPSLMCHCASCKRRSGGIASYASLIPKNQVTITGDTHSNYEDPDTGSRKPMQRSLCTYCGSPVRIIEGSAPDTWCMQYGLFADEVHLPPPRLELFRSKACAWVREVGKNVRQTQ